MRTFHTQNHSGLELQGDVSSIGRGSSPPLLQTGILENKKTCHANHDRSFSAKSKWSVMIKNLKQGLEFMNKQNSNLNEMEQALARWRMSPEATKPYDELSFSADAFLYLQTILTLSEEKMFNHPLFGCGVETPIRIHLNLKGERFIQEVPVVPLLCQPGFSALAHSGGGMRRPSESLFDSCQLEFMNALLSLNQNLDGMKRQLDEIEKSHSNSSLGLALVNTERESSPPVSSGVSRIFKWASRFLKAPGSTASYCS